MPTDYTLPRTIHQHRRPDATALRCGLCNRFMYEVFSIEGLAGALDICPECFRAVIDQGTALLASTTKFKPTILSLDAQHLQDEMNRLNGDGWVAKDVSPTRVRAERLNEFVEYSHVFNGGNPMWFCSRASDLSPRHVIAPWKRLTPSKETDR